MPFIRGFVIAGLAPLAFLFLVGAYIQPLVGDLTRVGRVAERSWGWNEPRFVIERLPNMATPTSDVIVVGDSFSLGNAWQSAAQRASGLSFVTYHWDEVGPPVCLERAIERLREMHPRARVVIVQTVERHFVRRFANRSKSTATCPTSLEPNARDPQPGRPDRQQIIDLSAGLPDPRYALDALIAERRDYDHTQRTGKAYVAPLTRRDLFSNRRSGHLLYFEGDLDKDSWTREQIRAAAANMRGLAERLRSAGVRPLFLVIPDKTTVYAPYVAESIVAGPHAELWGELENASVPSIDLNTLFAREVTRYVDFYYPNDTHYGDRARALMAQEVASALQAVGHPESPSLSADRSGASRHAATERDRQGASTGGQHRR
jgi:hypothetical protein